MIYYVEGDILKTKAAALAHGVAPNDDCKSGLALALREQWPGMYSDLRHYYRAYHPKPGTLWIWSGVGGVRIVSLFTQEPAPENTHAHPGKAHLEYVNHALRELAKLIEEEKLASIALPRLATGVGRLEWNDVKALIEKHLGGLSTAIYVYEEYKPGIAAEEPGT
ncbi:macro domain-containing protein [Armatimonas sp.]|uniref:macro domain-containing protein n=1 Tax=Armatimonas sp. TaxID=1872638 RepID=UPI00374D4A31